MNDQLSISVGIVSAEHIIGRGKERVEVELLIEMEVGGHYASRAEHIGIDLPQRAGIRRRHRRVDPEENADQDEYPCEDW